MKFPISKISSVKGTSTKNDIASLLSIEIPVLLKAKLNKHFFVNGGIAGEFGILSKREKPFDDKSREDILGARKFGVNAPIGFGIFLPRKFAVDMRFSISFAEKLHNDAENIHARLLKMQLGISPNWKVF